MRMFITVLLTMIFLTSCASANYQCEQETNRQKLDQSNEIPNDTLSFLPEGTIVQFRRDNRVFCFLPRDTEIQGIMCRGGGHSWQTVFYPNGKLAVAWLAQTEEIQGVPCMAASFWTELFGEGAMTSFHDNGNLLRCMVAKDVTIEGHAFKKGDHVNFDREGRLIIEK